jgi:tetratricopeptide (TPR) repeat protein
MNDRSRFLPDRYFIGLWRARKELLASLLLFLLVLATFLPAIGNDFVGYDDPQYVSANPHVQQGLSWETTRWAFSNTEVAAWHPLVWLSHALDYQLFGLRTWGHHLTGVLLHALDAVLCFLVLFGLSDAFGRSWSVAALFALHPLRVESVAWVSERKDVLSMAFFFLTLWAYSRYVKADMASESKVRETEKRPGGRMMAKKREGHGAPSAPGRAYVPNFTFQGLPSTFFGLSLLFFALGLMSKPMLVTVPLILLLLDGWPLRRYGNRDVWALVKEKIPFLVAALVVSLVTVLAQPHGGAMPGWIPLISRLENAAVSYCRYLGIFFWPVGLAPFYPPVEHWPAIIWIAAGSLLLAITLITVKLWRKHPYLLVGWLWFLVTLVPVVGVIQIGEQSITDRYSYLPSLGLFMSLVWGISELTARWRFQALALGTLLGVVLAVYLGLSREQVAFWKNTDTLFRHTLSVTRGNYLAHNNLGVVMGQQGRWAEAINQYQLALKIKPTYPEALVNLGVAFDHLGQLDKAAEFYQAALQQRPNFAAAHNGLGLVYEKQGQFQAAALQFQAALKIDPGYADAHFQLALELERQGQLDQAAAEFARTLQLQPNSADVHSNLGVLCEKQGRLDAAIEQYLAALRINPNYARGYFNLGVVLTKQGNINGAIDAFQTALKLNPDYPAARTNLAILKSLRHVSPQIQADHR